MIVLIGMAMARVWPWLRVFFKKAKAASLRPLLDKWGESRQAADVVCKQTAAEEQYPLWLEQCCASAHVLENNTENSRTLHPRPSCLSIRPRTEGCDGGTVVRAGSVLAVRMGSSG